MYRVVWLPSALTELTALWSGADAATRPVLAWAIGDVDYRLTRRPEDEGESRPGNRRIVFSLPLVVMYEVDTQANVVRIGHAWAHI